VRPPLWYCITTKQTCLLLGATGVADQHPIVEGEVCAPAGHAEFLSHFVLLVWISFVQEARVVCSSC
jgi:hypothetical protein